MNRKSFIILGLTAITLFSGCARHYVIRMTNGTMLSTASKPRLNEQGYYVFKDSSGQEQKVNAMRVTEVAPRGAESSGTRFSPYRK